MSMTETEGNSWETVCFVDPRLSRVHKTYFFPEVPVNKYFIIYQESKKRKNNEISY